MRDADLLPPLTPLDDLRPDPAGAGAGDGPLLLVRRLETLRRADPVVEFPLPLALGKGGRLLCLADDFL